jgi:hypothetical protein
LISHEQMRIEYTTALRLEKNEVGHIIVKKPKPEKEKVRHLKNIFKGENYIQIPIRIKDNYIVIAYAKDCWKLQAMEYFKEREFHWPYNGGKVSIIVMNLAMSFKWDGQWKDFSAILDRKKNDQFDIGRPK